MDLDEKRKEQSYLKAMLTSNANINAGILSALASALLSYKYGAAGAMLPLIAFGAGEFLAAMFIPTMSTFRHSVDKKARAAAREALRRQLTSDLDQRADANADEWRRYGRMRDVALALERLRAAGRKGVGEAEVERVEDSCNDYLGLWLSQLRFQERAEMVDEQNIDERIESVRRQAAEPGADRVSLDKALRDLEALRARYRRMNGRQAAVEAAMLSLPDAAEEIYHAAAATASAESAGPGLQEAIDRLRLNEEIQHSLEFDDLLPTGGTNVTPITQAPAKAAARRTHTTK